MKKAIRRHQAEQSRDIIQDRETSDEQLKVYMEVNLRIDWSYLGIRK